MPDDVILDYGTVAHVQTDGSVILEDEHRLFTLTKEALEALRNLGRAPAAAEPPAGPAPGPIELRGRLVTNGPVAYIQDDDGGRREITHLLEAAVIEKVRTTALSARKDYWDEFLRILELRRRAGAS